MIKMIVITQDLLKELFDYRDGNLYWNVRKAKNIKIGDRAGTVIKRGYRQVIIDGKHYYNHRLIFLYHYGYIPEFLDHIDGNPSNNDIDNLREATTLQNQWNRKKDKFYNGESTSSGFKGVSWYKKMQKWRSQIQINGKKKHLGYYDSEINAAKAYDKTAKELFGKFVRPNYDEIKMVDEV